MRVSYTVELKMGHDLNANGIERLRELIAEAVKPIGVEFLADIIVAPDNILPGPVQPEEGQDESRSNQ